MSVVALFDKSFLQSLSVDESVWFDRFFLPVVCPIFFVETLADLAKAPSGDRSVEAGVRIISSKFPDMSGTPCDSHMTLGKVNLLGHDVPMNGRIPLSGGRQVQRGGRLGYVFKESPESEAFHRWQTEQFHDVEHRFAAQWRAALENVDLAGIAKMVRDSGLLDKAINSFDRARTVASSIVDDKVTPLGRIAFAARAFEIPSRLHPTIISRWSSMGRPSLGAFAPYAAFVMMIELFFQIALAAGLISPERKSNRTDIAYLFYLPFCSIFTSSDRLHQRVSRVFLRDDQEFVWGPDLKADLKSLNEHYLCLPSDEREKGIMKFADRPPLKGEFLVTKLWERHLLPTALRPREPTKPLSPEQTQRLLDEIESFNAGATVPSDKIETDDEKIDAMSIQRRVRKKKGSWWQVPKDLPDHN